MSNQSTITIPAALAARVHGGLYSHLQSRYAATEAPLFAHPSHPDGHYEQERQDAVQELHAALDALLAAGYETSPPRPIELDLHQHRGALLAAVQVAAEVAVYLKEALPAEDAPGHEHAASLLDALRDLHEDIEGRQVEPLRPRDPFLERLLILIVLDTGSRTRTELQEELDEYPVACIDRAVGELAALGLLVRTAERVLPSEGLRRVDQLNLICI
jgi:hypothetical protein